MLLHCFCLSGWNIGQSYGIEVAVVRKKTATLDMNYKQKNLLATQMKRSFLACLQDAIENIEKGFAQMSVSHAVGQLAFNSSWSAKFVIDLEIY